MISPQQGALAMDGGEPALRSTCTGTPMPPHVRSQAPVATEPARTAHATIRTSAPAMPSAPSSAKLGACLEGGGARSVRITRTGVAAPKPGIGVPLIHVSGFWVCVYNRKAGNPHMAASHVPAFLDFCTWLPAMCALSRSSASSCQQLAHNPQMRAIDRPRAC
jgi:hypothetical protein